MQKAGLVGNLGWDVGVDFDIRGSYLVFGLLCAFILFISLGLVFTQIGSSAPVSVPVWAIIVQSLAYIFNALC
jgi:hypothetical protein